MKTCPRCGAQSYDNVSNCFHCGLPFYSPSSQMFQSSEFAPQFLPQQSPQQIPSTQQLAGGKSKWKYPSWVKIIVALLGLLILILIERSISANSNKAEMDRLKYQTTALVKQIDHITMTKVALEKEVKSLSEQKNSAAVPVSAPIAQPIVIPASSDMQLTSLYDEFVKISDMTEIQQKPYMESLIGRDFILTGTVSEVESDGKVRLNLEGSRLISSVSVFRYPSDRLASLQKSSTISIVGRVKKVTTFMMIMMEVDYIRDM